MTARNDDLIALMNEERRCGADYLRSGCGGTHTLNENTASELAEMVFKLLNGHWSRKIIGSDLVGAEDNRSVAHDVSGISGECGMVELLFVFLCLLTHFFQTAEHCRSEIAKQIGGTDGAEDVGDGVADGNEINPRLFSGGVHIRKAADGVGADTDDCRDCLRSGEKTGRHGGVIVHYFGTSPCHHETQDTYHYSEENLLYSLSADGRNKLRPALIADGKKEDQEKERLQRRADLNRLAGKTIDTVAHGHANEKNGGDSAERKRLVLEFPEIKTESNREENRNRGIFDECVQ